MNEHNEVTREQGNRAIEIAKMFSKLPEREQEMAYLMMKGIEFAASPKAKNPVRSITHAAV